MKKNLTIKTPGRGDILCLNAQKKMRFIAAGTFDQASFPKDWETVGVVYNRQGNSLAIVNKNSTTKKWCEIFRNRVSGWNLDGGAHTTDISFYEPMPAPEKKTFTYQGTTIEEVVEQLQIWFNEYAITSKKTLKAYKRDENSLYVFIEPYDNWYEYIIKFSGLTVDYDTAQELPANSNTYALNGLGGEYKGINWDKYLEYVHDATSSTFNPSKPVESLPSYPLSYKSYSNEIGVYVRNIYGVGEEGYQAYLRANMIEFPAMRGALGEEFRDGHHNTYALAPQTYPSLDGTVKPMFPAAFYCSEVSYDNPHLAKGRWYLPSLYEQLYIYKDNKTDYSDIVNQSLVAIGGTKLHFASAWSSTRYGARIAWFFNGYAGFSSNDNFYISFWSVPCVLLDLSECEELND